MKYAIFVIGMWLSLNEAFDIELAFAGIGLMVASGTFIVERIKQLTNPE